MSDTLSDLLDLRGDLLRQVSQLGDGQQERVTTHSPSKEGERSLNLLQG